MKYALIFLLLAIWVSFLAYTNPKMSDYDQFINQRILEKAGRPSDPLTGMLGSVIGGFAANLLSRQTLRKDYIVFSSYDTAVGSDHLRAIGILNHFFLTEDAIFAEQAPQP